MSDRPSEWAVPRRPEGVHGVDSGGHPVDRIWARLRRPLDTPAVLEALVGLPSRAARQLVSASIAGSDEAAALLAVMPALIRELSISTMAVPERVVGQIRGPVLWSETLSARSASAGDPSLFVCATVARAYDTPETRLLAAALSMIARGARDVERLRQPGRQEPPLFTTARRHGDAAQRFLDHRALTGVRRDRIARRPLARLQHDPRRRAYRPVADMLARASEPLDPVNVRVYCDARTVGLHDLLLATADHLARRGVRLPPFLVADHALVAGPVRFRHPGHPGVGSDAGVSVGTVRLDVAGSEPPIAGAAPISGSAELHRVLDTAIEVQRL